MRLKYRNNPVKNGNGRFDSRLEAGRYTDLLVLQRIGEISDLERQVPIKLTAGGKPICYDNGRQAKLVVDFRYCDNGLVIYEDTKGYETPTSKLKRAIARTMGIDVRLVE